MDVLVVESPAKAKTIGKYLGPGYTVLASYGHVRDLPAKDGSVRPDEDFAMDWLVDLQSQKRLDAIAKAVRRGAKLYLATDPDREGEAISWHVRDVLKRKKALEGVDVTRVTLNAITKPSVLDAAPHPRDLARPLTHAYTSHRPAQTRLRRSSPRPCSRNARASSGWGPPPPCESPRSSTRASISAARPLASSPICGPTACSWHPRRSARPAA